MIVLVCFKCKEYIFLNEAYLGKQRVKEFELKHQNHPRQVVMDKELPQIYKNVTEEIDEVIFKRSHKTISGFF